MSIKGITVIAEYWNLISRVHYIEPGDLLSNKNGLLGYALWYQGRDKDNNEVWAINVNDGIVLLPNPSLVKKSFDWSHAVKRFFHTLKPSLINSKFFDDLIVLYCYLGADGQTICQRQNEILISL